MCSQLTLTKFAYKRKSQKGGYDFNGGENEK